MPKFLIEVIRTETITRRGTVMIDLPSNDLDFVRQYSKMMAGDEMRYHSGVGIDPVLSGRERNESVAVTVTPLSADYIEEETPTITSTGEDGLVPEAPPVSTTDDPMMEF